jgi:hypothetical protein
VVLVHPSIVLDIFGVLKWLPQFFVLLKRKGLLIDVAGKQVVALKVGTAHFGLRL